MRLFGVEQLEVEIAGNLVCRDLSFELTAGMIVGILGANGAGKTTLLHTLAGLRQPVNGTINLREGNIENYSARKRAREIGVLFQDQQDPLHANVMQTALAGRHPHLPRFSLEQQRDYDITREALRETGLEDKSEVPVTHLSGGEHKRLGMATLLTQSPHVYLLDEPNSHLDLHYQITLLDILTAHLHECGGIAIMVLHDVNLLLRFCDQALLLFGNGEFRFGRADTTINTKSLTRLYAHPMREVADGSGRIFVPA